MAFCIADIKGVQRRWEGPRRMGRAATLFSLAYIASMGQALSQQTVEIGALGTVLTGDDGSQRAGAFRSTIKVSIPALRKAATPEVEAADEKLSGTFVADMFKRGLAEILYAKPGGYSYKDIPGEAPISVFGVGSFSDVHPLAARGRMYFGANYVPWPISVGATPCTIEIKNAVLVRDATTLYGNDQTMIRATQCWLPIGSHEFKGELSFSPAGITVAQGGEVRKR